MQETYIVIADREYMKPTAFNRVKVAVWNFILPPHVRLYLPKLKRKQEES